MVEPFPTQGTSEFSEVIIKPKYNKEFIVLLGV